MCCFNCFFVVYPCVSVCSFSSAQSFHTSSSKFLLSLSYTQRSPRPSTCPISTPERTRTYLPILPSVCRSRLMPREIHELLYPRLGIPFFRVPNIFFALCMQSLTLLMTRIL